MAATLLIAVALLAQAQTKTQLVMLGSGTPRLDPQRFGPSAAVVVNGASYLVDCGPGLVRRTSAARSKVGDALSPKNLKTVFVTHLHSDHTLGYPDLILSPWVVGRTAPLSAYGPVGLKAMTDHLLAAYREDIDVRTSGLEHGNKTGYKVEVHEIKPGVVFKDANVTVTAFRVKHGSWKEAFGYRLETADRVIVFSGDSAPCAALEEAAKGCDTLVHEVYAMDEAAPEKRQGGEDWVKYMRAFHTSSLELGALAARCKPKLLILNHILRRKATDGQLIAEIRQGGFTGPVVVGEDLAVY